MTGTPEPIIIGSSLEHSDRLLLGHVPRPGSRKYGGSLFNPYGWCVCVCTRGGREADLSRMKPINPSTMSSHGKKILQEALRCRRQHFWKSPWSASPALMGSLKRGSPIYPTWSKPSCCQVQPTSRAQAKYPPRSSAPCGRSGSLNCSSHSIQGPDTLGRTPAQDPRAPTCPLPPRVLLRWLTTELPLTPAPLSPAAPGPLEHSLISGTGGRPGPGSQLSRAGAQQGETHYMGLTGFKRR